MTITVKLKLFHQWPCQREGFPDPCTPSFRHEAYEKLSGIEIELDDARRSECASGGRAWGVTDETLQRMYAIGLIAPHAWIPRRDALSLHVCEHMIEPWSLASALFLAKVRRRQPCRPSHYGRSGKFFYRIWNDDGSGPMLLGRVVECLGDRGLPLYRAELFPESERVRGDTSTEYFFGEVDMKDYRWHFFDSLEEMRRSVELITTAQIQNSEPDASRPN